MSKHALFTLALAAGAALAAAVPAVGDARTLRQTVSHAAIDLATPAGRSLADAKVRRVAERFCVDPNERRLSARRAQRDCVAEVIAAAQPGVDSAVARDLARAAERYAALAR